MKISALVTVAVIALGSCTLSAACVAPEAPEIPDGTNSDKDTFTTGYQRVKRYLAKGDAYLKCLSSKDRAASKAGHTSDDTQAARRKLYNATVDEMRRTDKKLDKEKRKFKARTDQ